ncbi:MAG TPA: hypothetical protein VJM11_04935 [Nevskiaceae bacterium]|nr:hypothetical protein [Nevskiaceae bacterium]
MSDKQHLGPGSTKDRLDAALDWNAAIERQAGKQAAEERRRPRMDGAAAGSEVPDPEADAPGDRGC